MRDIYRRDIGIAAYLFIFQENHLIPFANIGLVWLGYVFYIIIFLFVILRWGVFLRFTTVTLAVFNSLYFKLIFIISALLIVHGLVDSVDTQSSSLLVLRYFTQLLPVIFFMVIWIGGEANDGVFDDIASGLLRYGFLLAVILVVSGNILQVSNLVRKDIADTVGMSPIAVTRTGCTMLITSIYIWSKNGKIGFQVLAGLVGMVLIVLGMSRGPLFATIIVSLGWIHVRRKEIVNYLKRKPYLIMTGFCFTFLLTIGLLSSSIGERYLERIQGLDSIDDTYRFQRWIFALDYFKSDYDVLSFNGIFGVGPAGFDATFGLNYAHNIFLEFAFEYGLVGFLLVIILAGYLSINYYRYCSRYRKREYLALIALYLFICANFSGDLIGWRNMFFITCLMVISNKEYLFEDSYN